MIKDDRRRFTWDIHYKCNFRCPYCWFYGGWDEAAKRNVYLSPEEWMVHWERIYKKYNSVHIEITGGEPFIYPNFIELVRCLSKIHTVKITTNLSGDIETFVRKISPERVELDLNFHPLFADLDTFIKKVLILKEAGFEGGVCYLAYPPQMKQMDTVRRRFETAGIGFALAAFWGEYRGVKYPEGYSPQQREIIRPYLGNIDRITYHLNAQSPKGKLCNAGYRYASIKADGRVVRCGPLGDVAIGNIMDEDFKLLEEPMPCQADFCPCDEYINLIDEEKTTGSSVSKQESNAEKEDDHPKFPRLSPPYRVHWNWEPSYRCNYNCSYCPWWEKGQQEKAGYVDIGRWKDVWYRIFENYGCCHIRFSGGEPTIYPNFFDLVCLLLRKHTVDITTNLSFDLDDFTRKIKSGGISISASFHLEFDEFDSFLEKVLFLRSHGFLITIAYVAYPPHLEKTNYFKSRSEEKGVMFKVIPFNGQYQGKSYPRDYTAQQRCIMEGLTKDSVNSDLNELNTRWFDWHVGRPREDRVKKDRLCRMGQMYAKIYPDGMVARCCATDKDGHPVGILGNIFDSDFRLLDAPLPCEAEFCPCFKSMLVGCEEDKWFPLWEAPEHPVYKTGP